MTTSTLTKKKLSIGEAAEQWANATQTIKEQKALADEAAPILLAYFERTGRKTYKDTVGVRQGPPRTILDQQAVKEFLGGRLSEFQTTADPKPSLYLL